MKLAEFKAWFDGFTEGMEGPPSAKQWKRIKEQVAAIDGASISYPVYIDRYVRPYHRWYESWDFCNNPQNLRAYSTSSGAVLSQNGQNSFDSCTAMYAAGKAEATSFIHDNGV